MSSCECVVPPLVLVYIIVDVLRLSLSFVVVSTTLLAWQPEENPPKCSYQCLRDIHDHLKVSCTNLLEYMSLVYII